jgi:hypothetical protein
MDVLYQRLPNLLFRRSFNSIVVASPSRPGLVLLEGLLARAWDCLEQPASIRQLSARLELASADAAVSRDTGRIVDHLCGLGLVAVATGGVESA